MRSRFWAVGVLVLLAVAMTMGSTHAQAPVAGNACYGTSGFNGDWTRWEFGGAGDFGSAACLSGGPEAALSVVDRPGDPWAVLGIPFGTFGANVHLQGTGTMACGEGSLSGSGYLNTVANGWNVQWEADFSGGIGTLTGTAVSSQGGVTKALSGTIRLNDWWVDWANGGNLRCDDGYHPMNPMPEINYLYKPPGSIPTEFPAGFTLATFTLSD